MSITGSPSTLRERIAALQQRGTSPQPSSPPRPQTPTSSPNAAGTALRDKIARFEQKGGTPIPRGSFGLGAPAQSTGRRNNELWGNRLPSAGKPPGAAAPSTDPAASVYTDSAGSQRRASVQVTHFGNVREPQETTVVESVPKVSHIMKSLDITRHNTTSPSLSLTTLTNSTVDMASLEKPNRELSPEYEPVMKSVIAPSPSPSSSPPPAIVIHDGIGGHPSHPSNQDSDSPEGKFGVGLALIEPALDNVSGKKPQTKDPPVFSLLPAVDPLPRSSEHSFSHSLTPVEENISETSLRSLTEKTVAAVTPHPESLRVEPLVPILDLTEETSELVEDRNPLPASVRQEASSLNAPSASSITHQSESLSLKSVNQPPSTKSVVAGNVQDLVSRVKEVNPDSSAADGPLGDATAPTRLATDALMDPPLSVITNAKVLPSKEGAATDVEAFLPKKIPLHRTDVLANPPTEPSQTPEVMVPSSTSPTAYATLPKIREVHNPESRTSARYSPATTNATTLRLSTPPFDSEAPSDSPPHVTPILDAFPAVPRFLPSSSLPARARTISGRPRTADRMSASSMSSTQSTPSLSFSPASSSTSSPTLAKNTAPRQPPASLRHMPGLQRSKSQIRPISSVPAWYDDDSDDGEAGWANVIVTTRRY